MGGQGGVVLLDDDADLRAASTEVVEAAFDRECVAVGSYAELVAMGQDVLRYPTVFLDINLGPDVPSGLDAYRWLRQSGFRGAVVFLTGHGGSHPMVVEAKRLGDDAVVSKPASIDQLSRLITSEP